MFGRKIAIDASISIYQFPIYQFLIAVRERDGEMLMNEAGETTKYVTHSLPIIPLSYNAELAHRSHLMGFFYRTIRTVENGIKPAYIFDGTQSRCGKRRPSLSPTPMFPLRTTNGSGICSWQNGLKARRGKGGAKETGRFWTHLNFGQLLIAYALQVPQNRLIVSCEGQSR